MQRVTIENFISTVNGSLGEGISLTIAERKKLAEAWMNVSKGR